VPIVPVVAIGGQETALFLTRGRRLAKLLKLDTAFRLKVLPVQIGPPFGITVFDLPTRIPLPAQLTIQVLPPVDLDERFGADADLDLMHDALTADMQRALDELAAERDIPVIGTIGSRADHSQVADDLAARK
jgi:1-acyl-sn-glycerol-3-phosphate acyltransferase